MSVNKRKPVQYSGDGIPLAFWKWDGESVSDHEDHRLFESSDKERQNQYLPLVDLHLASCAPAMLLACEMVIQYYATKDSEDLDFAKQLAQLVVERHNNVCSCLEQGMSEWPREY